MGVHGEGNGDGEEEEEGGGDGELHFSFFFLSFFLCGLEKVVRVVEEMEGLLDGCDSFRGKESVDESAGDKRDREREKEKKERLKVRQIKAIVNRALSKENRNRRKAEAFRWPRKRKQA